MPLDIAGQDILGHSFFLPHTTCMGHCLPVCLPVYVPPCRSYFFIVYLDFGCLLVLGHCCCGSWTLQFWLPRTCTCYIPMLWFVGCLPACIPCRHILPTFHLPGFLTPSYPKPPLTPVNPLPPCHLFPVPFPSSQPVLPPPP